MSWPYRHFSPEEVLSPDGLRLFEEKGICMVRPEAMDMLERWREDLGSPLFVNHQGLVRRGYRSASENAALPNSSKWSQHVQGVAFDVSCPDVPPRELFYQALDFGWTGVGLYKTFVHVDLRHTLTGGPMKWSGR